MECRELTRQERNAIRALVVKWCANYDREYDCLPLDCPCVMLGKCWTGAYCRYFRDAVLPLDLALEEALIDGSPDYRACPVCGRPVPKGGRRRYCSTACAEKARRKRQRGYMQKRRAES